MTTMHNDHAGTRLPLKINDHLETDPIPSVQCGVVWCGVVWCGVVWCAHTACHHLPSPATATFSPKLFEKFSSAALLTILKFPADVLLLPFPCQSRSPSHRHLHHFLSNKSLRCSTLRVSRKRDKTTPAYELHGQTIENVSTTKYLGVNIQENMQWESHIDSITKKANKTLGFIRRNLKIGNKKTKETAYKALVRPFLEYAASVWDPYTANEIETLEKIQRRAARWVVNRHRQTSCVDTILDSLNWPPLQQLSKKARLETFYKLHHGLVSIDSKYLPKPSNSRLSSRTNNSLSYDIPTCTTRYRQMAFFPKTIPEWNKLPQEVVTAESLDCFKFRLASHLQKVTHPTPTPFPPAPTPALPSPSPPPSPSLSS
ncbi:hypothetical protein ACOMHN_008050 [Nucella lapillus]